MSDKRNDPLGDRLKKCEDIESMQRITTPFLVARLDGRGFSKFTKGLKRPYDERLSALMENTTKYLIESLNPLLGYTQSDEISLFWTNENGIDYPFGGRKQKLVSTLAALATGYFNKHLHTIPEKSEWIPTFDCRVISVETLDDVLDNFIWRERDANKNAISMAASTHINHHKLLGVHSDKRIEMLKELGINFDDYPTFFKHGVYLHRKTFNTVLTEADVAQMNVPEKVAATLIGKTVERNKVVQADFVSLEDRQFAIEFMKSLYEN